MARAFLAYVARQPDMPLSVQALSAYGVPIPERVVVPAAEASRMLGVCGNLMLKLAAREGLFIKASPAMGLPFGVSVAGVKRLLALRADGMEVGEVSRELGISHNSLRKLTDKGFISVVPPEQRLFEKPIYWRTEIAVLKAKCMGDAVPMTEKEAEQQGLLAMGSIRKVGTGLETNKLPLYVAALLDGRLQAAGVIKDKKGLLGLRYRPQDVKRAFRKSGPQPMLNHIEFGTLVGVPQGLRLVGLWRERGLIRGVLDASGKYRYSQTEPEEFRSKYVCVTEDPWNPGSPIPPGFTKQLERLGILPVSGGGVDRGLLPVFRRSQLTPDVLEKARALLENRGKHASHSREDVITPRQQVIARVEQIWGERLLRASRSHLSSTNGKLLVHAAGFQPHPANLVRFKVSIQVWEATLNGPDAWLALIPPSTSDACCKFLLLQRDAVRHLAHRWTWVSGKRDWQEIVFNVDERLPAELARYAVV